QGLVADGLDVEAIATVGGCDVVVLADGGDAAVELVMIFLAIEVPDAQRLLLIAGDEVAAGGHADHLGEAERSLGAPAGGDGGADGAADVVPPVQELSRRNAGRVGPAIGLRDDLRGIVGGLATAVLERARLEGLVGIGLVGEAAFHAATLLSASLASPPNRGDTIKTSRPAQTQRLPTSSIARALAPLSSSSASTVR